MSLHLTRTAVLLLMTQLVGSESWEYTTLIGEPSMSNVAITSSSGINRDKP